MSFKNVSWKLYKLMEESSSLFLSKICSIFEALPSIYNTGDVFGYNESGEFFF